MLGPRAGGRVILGPRAGLPVVIVGGGGAGVINYHHMQLSPSQTWTIVHNLGWAPGGILVRDSTGGEVEGEISYPDPATTVTLYFPAGAISGDAYLS
jgi:hypothetical protein